VLRVRWSACFFLDRELKHPDLGKAPCEQREGAAEARLDT
jgi:hypothetical protein